ncbi:MAG: adenylyl-sulfate kinase [Aquabacterium sp.]
MPETNQDSGFRTQFEARIHWQHSEAGIVGKEYLFQVESALHSLIITRIKHQLDPKTGAHLPCRSLRSGDLGVCNVWTSVSMETPRRLQLVDQRDGLPLAVVEFQHALHLAQNLHTQLMSVKRKDREILNGHPGFVLWFTGLSGSGKSTIANALEHQLHKQGWHTYVLDGDNVRQGLNNDLGFTDADRAENIRRVAEVAKLMVDAGLIVITAFISPFRKEREMARNLIGSDRFLEVHVNTPLEVCEARDVKGLYQKARKGVIPNMTGINSPYEAPENAGVIISGASNTWDTAVKTLADMLQVKSAELTSP